MTICKSISWVGKGHKRNTLNQQKWDSLLLFSIMGERRINQFRSNWTYLYPTQRSLLSSNFFPPFVGALFVCSTLSRLLVFSLLGDFYCYKPRRKKKKEYHINDRKIDFNHNCLVETDLLVFWWFSYIYCLFNDVVNSSDCYSANDRDVSIFFL